MYNLSYTTSLPLVNMYEEQAFVASITGLWNRASPNVFTPLSAMDTFWLGFAQSCPGGWLCNSTITTLPSLEALVSTFSPTSPPGVVLVDPAVPSTMMLGLTIAGSDGLLPIPYRPEDPTSLYSRLVEGGPSLKVALSLVGNFTHKSQAYAWSIARQLATNATDGQFLAYYGDLYVTRPPYSADPDAGLKINAVNFDYTVAHRGFFFDLSPWGDEVPIDDPGAGMGEDLASLHALLGAAYRQRGESGAPSHISGFVPWWAKYVGPFSPHGHEGVAAEWAYARVASAYDAFMDADACCIGNFAGASFWEHAPLPPRLVQPPPPSPAALASKGWLDPVTLAVPPGHLFYNFYSGDYDSAAWLLSQLISRWNDPARGSGPITWPLDPEVSLRFPVIFPHLYATLAPGDVITAGDSGAGYLNPSMLTQAARVGVSNLSSGEGKWGAWNAAWYRQFGLSATGFVITGDGPTFGGEGEALYAAFSPNGVALQDFPGTCEHLGAGGVLPVVGQWDIPSDSPAAAAASMGKFMPANGTAPSRFWMFRSVLTSPTYLAAVASAANASSGGMAIGVDAVTLGYLLRTTMGGTNDNRVGYVGDTFPPSAPAGTLLSVAATVRNDGWNALASTNHSLQVNVTGVLWVTRKHATMTPSSSSSSGGRSSGGGSSSSSSGRGALAAAMGLLQGGSRGGFSPLPANPALAGPWLARRGLIARPCDGGRGGGGADPILAPFPADLELGGNVTVPIQISLPSYPSTVAAAGGGRVSPKSVCGDTMGEEGVAVAVIQYGVVTLGTNSSGGTGGVVPFSNWGVLPWVVTLVLV